MATREGGQRTHVHRSLTKNASERDELYTQIRERIGGTPFVEVRGLDLPGGCKIWAKEEYRNPTGSHYDRTMWRLLRELERANWIVPGATKMLETTTGNSGAAFAWLCRALKYPSPTIIIPEDMPYARIAQLKSYDADVILSPAGQYITGISDTYQRCLPEMMEKGYYSPQHWNDEYHAVEAMRELGDEILEDAEKHGVEFDYFMLALGNGSSARGVGRVLKGEHITLLGVEPDESKIVTEAIEKMTAGRWESTEPHRPHGILGTGPFRPSEIYRNMRAVIEEKLLEDILTPDSDDAKAMQRDLIYKSVHHVGMSSAAVVWAAREYMTRHKLRKKTFGVIFYDPAWKYL